MRKAFTLIELVVSLGILAAILSFAGIIFRVSVESQRMAMANAEVMQKLRIITEQLDADFKSGAFRPSQYPYVYDGYVFADTETISAGGKLTAVNSDGLVIFAAGDFRSTGQYGNRPIAGNVACVYYGQPDPNSYKQPPQPYQKFLVRRQTILAIDGPAQGADKRGEYYPKSPQEWLVNPPFVDANDWRRRPVVDPNNVTASLPMIVAQGVDNFTVHYLNAGTLLRTAAIPWVRPTSNSGSSRFNPRALRFTFTLYDSKGILKKGRTFTHIVVWDN